MGLKPASQSFCLTVYERCVVKLSYPWPCRLEGVDAAGRRCNSRRSTSTPSVDKRLEMESARERMRRRRGQAQRDGPGDGPERRPRRYYWIRRSASCLEKNGETHSEEERTLLRRGQTRGYDRGCGVKEPMPEFADWSPASLFGGDEATAPHTARVCVLCVCAKQDCVRRFIKWYPILENRFPSAANTVSRSGDAARRCRPPRARRSRARRCGEPGRSAAAAATATACPQRPT